MNPLCDLFPKLYAMVVSKEAKILEVWQNSEQGGGWNLGFQRSFNDREMENVEELIGIISDKEINTEEKNCCGKLIKKLLYCEVKYGVVGRGVVPKRLVWNKLVSTKVGFLCGELGGAR